ncbi:hypothetical protein VOLCADRAFT_86600 [Volvox carteri f. nagariensis]|uniref:Uncharacterized protein n=1 Tax=Volvox carteri f. nagariensis TaxID=3068 RepID=D8TJ37_VOLCA|nr:uncharacterized protein VOLCADRAFT_86600 [Volvox carteri f. nagariensis]EFJ52469.1 hypothetical protein VOLCADRAFT_86600 [Volvox carteri f. nagariensis]|eukprot:XP_002946542.1 hypothetical protein VOLCADRAFT_86600 [Volvox carteri f. nagariensis]
MTKGSARRRSKQQLGAEALAELKEGRVTPSRPEWSDRRPLRFWQPFNDWWRSELDRLGRRPNAQEINGWYEVHAYDLWKEDAPSLQETRVHAKCLRSLPLVRDYFRNYRAKKRSIGERLAANRQRRRSLTDRRLPLNSTYIPGEGFGYREDGEDGDDVDEGEEEDEDTSAAHDPDQPNHHEPMDADPGGVYPMGLGLDVEGYLSRDPTGAAAAAAAGLAQFASLRGASGANSVAAAAAAAAAGLPLELLHSGVPSLQSFMGSSAAALGSALWSSAAAAQPAAVLDAGRQHSELLRSLTLQQLQQAALQQQHHQHAQQQLALAAIAQNLALSRAAAGIPGIPGFPHHAAALVQPHSAYMSGRGLDERHAMEEAAYREGEQYRVEKEDGGATGGGRDGRGEEEEDEEGEQDEEEEEHGTVDFMELVAQQAANLGRGKRKRGPGLLGRRQDYDIEGVMGGRDAEGEGEDGTDTEDRAGAPGRAVGARRVGAAQLASRQRRGARGGVATLNGLPAAAVKHSTSRRQPVRAGSVSPEPAGGGARVGEGDEGREGDGERTAAALALVPLEDMQVPPALGLEPVPREALVRLAHEELSSPSKAGGPTRAASGSGGVPTEVQRSGSPVLGGDSSEQRTKARPHPPRAGDQLKLLEPAEATAVSVLAGIDMAPQAPMAPAPKEAAKASGGFRVAGGVGRGTAVPQHSRNEGDSGLPGLIQPAPQLHGVLKTSWVVQQVRVQRVAWLGRPAEAYRAARFVKGRSGGGSDGALEHRGEEGALPRAEKHPGV